MNALPPFGFSQSKRRWVVVVGLLLLASATFSLRSMQLRHLPPDIGFLISDPDAAYHLRLARLIYRNFPFIPSGDAFLNFPASVTLPWPFLQDFFMAGVNRLVPGGNEATLDIICVYYPAALSAATLFLIFGLARCLGLNYAFSLLAAALSSLVPVGIAYGTAGRYDHHPGDLFLSSAFFLATLRSWHASRRFSARRRGIESADLMEEAFWRPPFRLYRPWLAVALCLWLMFLNWTGGVIYLVIVLAATAAFCLLHGRNLPANTAAFLRVMSWSCLSSGVLLSLSMWAAYGPGRLAAIDANLPSGFQPLCLACSAVIFMQLDLLVCRGRRALRQASFRLLSVILIAAVIVGLNAFWRGYLFFVQPGHKSMIIGSEHRSVFVNRHSDLTNQHLSLASGVKALTWGVFLCPLFLSLLWRTRKRRPEIDYPAVFFLLATAVELVMALFQYRFGYVFTVPLGIGAAWLARQLWLDVRHQTALWRRLAAAAGLILVLVAFYPGVSHLQAMARDPYFQRGNISINEPLAWLAGNTPDPGDINNPETKPRYGVMAPWDIGLNVIAVAGRPVMASGFLDSFPGNMFAEHLFFFTEDDPREARRLMADNKLRYLILHNNTQTVLQAAYYQGMDELYTSLLTRNKEAVYAGGSVPVSMRLWDMKGSALLGKNGFLPATRHFRLLREDYFFYPGESALDITQIYELVAGARARGKAPPGSFIDAALTLMGSTGNRFVYHEAATANAHGFYELCLPYPTTVPSGLTRPLGAYEIAMPGRAEPIRLAVSEEDVLRGAVLNLNGK